MISTVSLCIHTKYVKGDWQMGKAISMFHDKCCSFKIKLMFGRDLQKSSTPAYGIKFRLLPKQDHDFIWLSPENFPEWTVHKFPVVPVLP